MLWVALKEFKSTNCYWLLCKNSTNARTILISCFWLLHRPTIKNMTLSKCYEWHCKNWRSISCYSLLCNSLMTERMSVCLWLKPLQPNHFLRCLSARFLTGTLWNLLTFFSDFESPRTSKRMCQLIFCRPHKIQWLILICPGITKVNAVGCNLILFLTCCHKWLPHTKHVIPRTERLQKIYDNEHTGCVR